MYVTGAMIQKHGKTEGCPGCRVIGTGRIATHSATCRSRLREELGRTEDGQNILDKDSARVDKKMEAAIRQEIDQDPTLKKEVQQHAEEVEQIRKRHRSTPDMTQSGSSGSSGSGLPPEGRPSHQTSQPVQGAAPGGASASRRYQRTNYTIKPESKNSLEERSGRPTRTSGKSTSEPNIQTSDY